MKTHDTNLNNSYYQSLDENFNHAIELIESEISQKEIITLLNNGNILQKQIAALKISTINNKEEADVLCSNLTGQDGKIREAISLKLIELLPKHIDFFKTKKIYNIFLDAIIDINPNVCRNMLDIITLLKTDNNFLDYFIPNLVEKTKYFIKEVNKYDFQDGKYKINKEVFKLYWCLEVIYELSEHIPIADIKTILTETKNINEYTIREKTAKILSKNFEDEDCKKIQEALKKDNNYYVRRYYE